MSKGKSYPCFSVFPNTGITVHKLASGAEQGNTKVAKVKFYQKGMPTAVVIEFSFIGDTDQKVIEGLAVQVCSAESYELLVKAYAKVKR